MKIFDQYQEIKVTIDTLNAELTELKPKLVKELQASDGSVKTKTADFSLRSNKIYEFSPSLRKSEKNVKVIVADHKETIKRHEDTIKDLKAKEIKGEVAVIKHETFTPVMRVIKKTE